MDAGVPRKKLKLLWKKFVMNKIKVISRINKSKSQYQDCVQICNASKNLYNVMTYIRRQAIFNEKIFLTDKEIYQQAKQHSDWKMMAGRVANQVWIQHCKAWKSYFQAKKSFDKNSKKFTACPKFPKYKKTDYNITVYEKQALNIKGLKQGTFKLSATNIIVKTDLENVKQIRIEPKGQFFEIKAIYTGEVKQQIKAKKDALASIDIGLNNLAAVTSNQADKPHFMINGRPLKNINQYWNKQKAKAQSLLKKQQYKSNYIEKITTKRNDKIKDYCHKASRYIIDYLAENQIGKLIIGKNKGWKQSIKIGKKNNQSFVQVPFDKFIQMLTYKAEEIGIKVIQQEESYTSKTSALDLEKPKKQVKYCGRRIKRGLFKTKTNKLINADINGSLQIMRKAVTNSLDEVIEGTQFIHFCCQPRLVTI
jgi:putative transposase